MYTIRFKLCVLLIAAPLMIASAQQSQNDPVEKANQANERKAGHDDVFKDSAEFLVAAADARLMDTKEGELATAKGTTAAIRDYGNLMIKDQAVLLGEIKKLAQTRQISIPGGISSKKEKAREALSKKTGKDFDKKFIRMMVIDHRRDLRLFTNAAESKDPDLSAFAMHYLPMVKLHLDKATAIKKAMK